MAGIDIGAHCAAEDCNRRDFLPFLCDCCQNLYCIDHRSYESHNCTAAQGKDRQAAVCPICKSTLFWQKDDNVDAVWEAHYRSGACKSAEGDSKPKERCSYCATALGPSNRTTCLQCRSLLCLPHRFPDAHNCRNGRAGSGGGGGSRAASRVGSGGGGGGGSASTGGSKVYRGGKAATERSTKKAKGAAAAAGASRAAAAAAAAAREICPTCGKSFATVTELIGHAETHVTAGAAAQPPSYVREQQSSGSGGCPFCGRPFEDPVKLVEHVEREHRGGGGGGRHGSGSSSASSKRGSSCAMN